MRARSILSAPAAFALLACLGPDGEQATVKTAWDEFRFPVLKAGESWTVEESAPSFHGATATLRIVKDTVFDSTDVYVGQMTIVVPEFLTASLDTVRHFTQSGRIFMRKSDQETVYETATVASDVTYRGDTAATGYTLESETITKLTGTAPAILKTGLKWTVAAKKTRSLTWYFDGVVGGKRDTVITETREFRTGKVAQVTVRAGSFAAIEIDWSVPETGLSTVSWFSEAAKATLKQIDTQDGEKDTTELTSLQLL